MCVVANMNIGCVGSCLSYFAISLFAMYLLSFARVVILPLFTTGSLKKFKSRYNANGKSWVIITGTTSGIGLSFCRLFAKLGFNILMISRDESKLLQVQKELSGVKVEYMCIDLSVKFDAANVARVKKFIDGHNVTVLVNNAGLNTSFPKMFVDNTVAEWESVLSVNCESLVRLTHMCLPKLIESNCGAVINVSSLFGELGGPLVSAYSGTKSFIDSFSRSLAGELKSTGVKIFCSLPGFVVTNMSKIRKTSLTVISSDQCVETILKQVACGYSSTLACPHWTHSAIGWFMMNLVPETLRIGIIAHINRKTNLAALRKIQKTK